MESSKTYLNRPKSVKLPDIVCLPRLEFLTIYAWEGSINTVLRHICCPCLLNLHLDFQRNVDEGRKQWYYDSVSSSSPNPDPDILEPAPEVAKERVKLRMLRYDARWREHHLVTLCRIARDYQLGVDNQLIIGLPYDLAPDELHKQKPDQPLDPMSLELFGRVRMMAHFLISSFIDSSLLLTLTVILKRQ